MAKIAPKQTLLEQIKDTIESLRTFINNDGGDLSFVSFKNGILTLNITGACVGCSAFSITFDQGVKEVFLTEFKGDIQDVKFTVNDNKKSLI
ncbi:MAG: NifU family protein [Mycoplasmataceae bacterium]|jgi:Fe-S cluster biogenesis protein NfuA|nr:NifU family protein [Mycoplasmataceae bacterium]